MLSDWSARLSLRYLSSLTEQCVGLRGGLRADSFCSNGPGRRNELDSVIYTDVQVSWAPAQFFDGDWTFTVGVNNLLNEEPPICFSCDLNSLDGTLYPDRGSVLVPEGHLRALEAHAGVPPATNPNSAQSPREGAFFFPGRRPATVPSILQRITGHLRGCVLLRPGAAHTNRCGRGACGN